MKITNNSPASQGIQTIAGLVYVRAGQARELDLTTDQAVRAGRIRGVTVEGKPVAAPVNDEKAKRNPDSGLQAKLDKAGDDLTAAQAEITTLKDRVAELELENEELKKQISAPVAPEAKHRGAGSYSIMEGDTELREKLTKEQADAFNALDAEGKAKWLSDNPKAAT